MSIPPRHQVSGINQSRQPLNGLLTAKKKPRLWSRLLFLSILSRLLLFSRIRRLVGVGDIVYHVWGKLLTGAMTDLTGLYFIFAIW